MRIAAKRDAQAHALESVKTLEAELAAALNSFDVPKARALRDRLNSLIADHALQPDGPLKERLAQALEWVAEQDNRDVTETTYQQAVRDLETALDKNAGQERLDKLLTIVNRLEPGVPDVLQARYLALASRRKWARRWKRFLITTTTAACLVAAVGAALFFGDLYLKKTRIATARTAVQQMLNEEQLPECRAYLEKLADSDPVTAQAPVIADLERRLQAAEKNDRERIVLFKEALKDAEAGVRAGDEDAAIAKASQLARFAEEKALVQGLIRARNERALTAQEGRDQALHARIAALDKKIKDADVILDKSFNAQALSKNLIELQKEANHLATDSRNSAEATRAALEAVAGRLDSVKQKFELTTNAGKQLERMTAALRSKNALPEYLKAAEEYVKEFPDSPRSQGLKQAIAEQSYWQEVLDWNALVNRDAGKPFEVKSAEAKKQAELWSEFLKARPKFVDFVLVRDYVKCLEAVVQQDGGLADSAAGQMRKLFENPSIKDLWMMQGEGPDARGQIVSNILYLTEKQGKEIKTIKDSRRNQVTVITYIVGPELSDVKKVQGLSERIKKIERAPQALIAEEYSKKNFSSETWDASTIQLATKIRGNQEVDSILQFILLDRVLNCAARGSYPLAQALVVQREELKKAKDTLDLTVNWLDPTNENAKDVRRRAGEAVKKLPGLDKVVSEAAKERQRIETALAGTRRTLAGWLARSEGEGEKWRVYLSAGKSTEPEELFVLVPRADQPAVWRRIGRVVNGREEIDAGAADVLVEGRWVFSRPAGK